MKNIVILTGAGISAESGIRTFRDCKDGLWEEFSIEEVATAKAIKSNPEKVYAFYNMRRKDMLSKKPNLGHTALKELEEKYNVHIITQNVDNLHEQAGSTNILHLHGELDKARSVANHKEYQLNGKDLMYGDKAPDDTLLRPHIVLFGEDVPNIPKAANIMKTADIVIIIGTSMNVYPAAGLIHYAPKDVKLYVIDPNTKYHVFLNATIIDALASIGVPLVVAELMK